MCGRRRRRPRHAPPSFPSISQQLPQHPFLSTNHSTNTHQVSRGRNVEAFYTMPEYEQWKEYTNGGAGWTVKYYKGLGTSTAQEVGKEARMHKRKSTCCSFCGWVGGWLYVHVRTSGWDEHRCIGLPTPNPNQPKHPPPYNTHTHAITKKTANRPRSTFRTWTRTASTSSGACVQSVFGGGKQEGGQTPLRVGYLFLTSHPMTTTNKRQDGGAGRGHDRHGLRQEARGGPQGILTKRGSFSL